MGNAANHLKSEPPSAMQQRKQKAAIGHFTEDGDEAGLKKRRFVSQLAEQQRSGVAIEAGRGEDGDGAGREHCSA